MPRVMILTANPGSSSNPAPGAAPAARRSLSSRLLRRALRILPRRLRFPAALVCARLLAPLVARTALYRRSIKGTDSVLDFTLYQILTGLTQDGTEFEPAIRVNGFELFEAAFKLRRGVLLISAHGALGLAFLRWLEQRGYSASVVSAGPNPHISGPMIARTRSYLLEIRDRLRRGEIVGAMIDRGRPEEGRTFPVTTARGTLHLADALIEVAAHGRASVIYFYAAAGARGIEIELESPASPEADARSIAQDFAGFLQRQVSGGGGR